VVLESIVYQHLCEGNPPMAPDFAPTPDGDDYRADDNDIFYDDPSEAPRPDFDSKNLQLPDIIAQVCPTS
jgi:hypothetical protein